MRDAMTVDEHEVSISTVDDTVLEGTLSLPEQPRGVVLFAHGSGSSRRSPRNRFVASILNENGFGTLLMDLLTTDEEEAERWTRHLRFDIELLARRLVSATKWITLNERTSAASIGYFGASTGAAAALVAATLTDVPVCAIVSRGGRPDLAGDRLGNVGAPTLLIVGGDDVPVIGMNRDAFSRLRCEKRIEIVPGASHLFEEPGTMEAVAHLAADWFADHCRLGEITAPKAAGRWHS